MFMRSNSIHLACAVLLTVLLPQAGVAPAAAGSIDAPPPAAFRPTGSGVPSSAHTSNDSASTPYARPWSAWNDPGHSGPFKTLANALHKAMPDGPLEKLLGRTYLEIKPAMIYRLEYEDNIDFDTSNKLSDFNNHYVPSIDLSAHSPLFSFESNTKLDITEYINEKQYNCVDQFYDIRIGYTPSERLQLGLASNYTVRSDIDRFDDADISAPAENYFRRYKDKTKSFGADATYSFTPRSSVTVQGLFARYDTINTDGSDFYSLNATYTHKLSPRTDLLLTAGYFYYDFKFNFKEDDGLDFLSFSYTIKNYSFMTGFEHTFDTDVILTMNAGFRYTENDGAFSGNGNGWIALLNMERRFNDFLISMEGRHDINVDSRGASYESTRFYLTNTYEITRRLTARVRLVFMRQYSDEDDEEFAGAQDINNYYVSSGLTYTVNRWLSVIARHSYRYNDNKRNGVTRNSNLLSIALEITPLRPLVLR